MEASGYTCCYETLGLNQYIQKKLKFTQKSMFLEITAQIFEAGDFFNIFLRFLGF